MTAPDTTVENEAPEQAPEIDGDDNVVVNVAPPEVTVIVEPPEPAPEPEPEPSVIVAPPVIDTHAIAAEVAAILTPTVQETVSDIVDEIPEPVEVEETESETEHEDAPPKSRRDHWYFRDHTNPLKKP